MAGYRCWDVWIVLADSCWFQSHELPCLLASEHTQSTPLREMPGPVSSEGSNTLMDSLTLYKESRVAT